ncbi:hypothetical protein BDP27DRAFT_1334837 [Rhodocollybia butyracea]|uniref:Transmembrane protein n=1 Tax=Rhodocollybia butyracea TaxID=206335 RepID=A0A9P5U2J4_9AGAR|nr:hypothetical protein BDP27DRAFT_1334837 [Rhodocollybia butyracea]
MNSTTLQSPDNSASSGALSPGHPPSFLPTSRWDSLHGRSVVQYPAVKNTLYTAIFAAVSLTISLSISRGSESHLSYSTIPEWLLWVLGVPNMINVINTIYIAGVTLHRWRSREQQYLTFMVILGIISGVVLLAVIFGILIWVLHPTTGRDWILLIAGTLCMLCSSYWNVGLLFKLFKAIKAIKARQLLKYCITSGESVLKTSIKLGKFIQEKAVQRGTRWQWFWTIIAIAMALASTIAGWMTNPETVNIFGILAAPVPLALFFAGGSTKEENTTIKELREQLTELRIQVEELQSTLARPRSTCQI